MGEFHFPISTGNVVGMVKELVWPSNSTLNLYIFHFHQWVAAFSTWAETRFYRAACNADAV